MSRYNPDNPLTEEELEKLGKTDFDAVLDYLDEKAKYLETANKGAVKASWHMKVIEESYNKGYHEN